MPLHPNYPIFDGGSREKRDWKQDLSSFRSHLFSEPTGSAIIDAVQEQDRIADEANKNFKRTVPAETFADNHYDGFGNGGF